MSHSRVPLLLGTGLMGLPGSGGRVEDLTLVQEFVDAMIDLGNIGIDTARRYCGGKSEELLGRLNLRGKARVDTKLCPFQPGDHAPEKLKAQFQISKAALKGIKIRVLYLHAPDRSVPFEDTLEAMNDLYQAGEYEELGLSNYAAYEVAEMVEICKRRGFVRPTIYEGVYNILDRGNEPELFPCLRKHGIRFAAYAALAGGYLTDRVTDPSSTEGLSHFDPKLTKSSLYAQRYTSKASAVAGLRVVVRKHNLSMTEVAYRWLQWHSQLRPDDHGILIAPSRKSQLEDALIHCAKGPLPDEVVKACEETWKDVRGFSENYFV